MIKDRVTEFWSVQLNLSFGDVPNVIIEANAKSHVY